MTANPAGTGPATPPPGPADLAGHAIDAWQRAILFWDVLRERANDVLDQMSAGMPDILAFRHETLLDARRFPRPANYALLRITGYGEDEAEHCLDPAKPPLIVIDPRAGHGPGIGGTRRDSELGIALHEGYPVYFVTFFPAPCPGQTLIDVLHAMRRFVDAVAARHAGRAPILYGNCQGGWAAMLVALHCEGPLGPIVLNGSPLSYWSGEPGVNPMRLAGGLSGGVWPVRLLADLGAGQFDGAWLVQNFEALKPENALWEKYLPLFLDPEGERERFLTFERWWNAFYALSAEEITTIIRQLFIGNDLERGVLDLGDGTRLDLQTLRSPLVVFASEGDNITPPHQALGWIARVYGDTDGLKRAGQRIVYLLNPKVGHLGIFVSAAVARFEHRAILEALDDVARLAPGLYEMTIDNPTGDPDCRRPQYGVAFAERRVEDLHFEPPPAAFERVRQVSAWSDAIYGAFVAPWMRAMANPAAAAMARWMHPMRTSRYLLSERFAPWMRGVALVADALRATRASAPSTQSPALESAERDALAVVTRNLKAAREVRDGWQEVLFRALYGGVEGRAPEREVVTVREPGSPRASRAA
ncbi:DUF3141 domain-containing protein [Neoroseomonas eburnea]|nr:DUF3141 domain-containing protein [Neoroseomonas eburnea]